MEENYVKLLFKHDAFEGNDVEGAWALKEGEFYKLDNILFYAKEFSWGDIIKAKKENNELYAESLIQESGHSTVRILFSDVSLVELTRNLLKDKGCSSELSNYEKLIAVDIPSEVNYKSIVPFFEKGENDGKWEYQEACISTHHKKQ
jgi:hypothetical protein